MNSTFLTAEWRKLAIANYHVDSKVLIPFLPYKTELDLWNNKCYVSLVGFRFVNTKLKGFGIPFHKHFEEVNLRFYVRYKDSTGWKRGVTFIKEIVPKAALTFIANTIYKEKYLTLPMKHSWDIQEDIITVAYYWNNKNRWNNFSLKAEASPIDIESNSEEEFITEHYWGYTHINEKCTSEYAVEHRKWKIYKVKESSIDVIYGELYGDMFNFLDNQRPDSVMLAEGSEIVVRSMNRIV